jgi:sodium-dependent phosphate transporter
MYLHQYDYIFAIGTLFAMLDAYNNGASEFYLLLTLEINH